MCQEERASPVEMVLMKDQYNHEEDENKEEQAEDEDDEELTQWSPDVQILELQKERDKGLGFSILDYQVSTQLSSNRCYNIRSVSFSLFFTFRIDLSNQTIYCTLQLTIQLNTIWSYIPTKFENKIHSI